MSPRAWADSTMEVLSRSLKASTAWTWLGTSFGMPVLSAVE